MRRLLGVFLLGGASLTLAQAPSSAALSVGPREYGARVSLSYVDGSDRGVGYYEGVRVEAIERLSIRGSRAALVVKGRRESRGAFLSPGGPERSRHHEEAFEHVWTGSARREGRGWALHFTHTTSTRPARACDERFSCVPDAEVRGGLRCTAGRAFGHHGNDRLIPTYLRVPLLLARGRALVVEASGSDAGGARVVARGP